MLATADVVRGAKGGIKAVVKARTPVELLHGVEMGLDSLAGGLVSSIANVAGGTRAGGATLVAGVESSDMVTRFTSRIPFAARSVHTAAGAATGAVNYVTDSAAAVVAGVLVGGASAAGGLAGGGAMLLSGGCWEAKSASLLDAAAASPVLWLMFFEGPRHD